MRRNRSNRTVRVWEVLVDIDGDGPAADGTRVFRFRSEREARTFAAGKTCYGSPDPSVTSTDAPLHLATRWGMA